MLNLMIYPNNSIQNFLVTNNPFRFSSESNDYGRLVQGAPRISRVHGYLYISIKTYYYQFGIDFVYKLKGFVAYFMPKAWHSCGSNP